MYVAMVKVGKVERAASYAVCWTEQIQDDKGCYNKHHVRLWGSEGIARQHESQIRDDGHATHLVTMPVYRGCQDEIWINARLAGSMTVSELSVGWFYRSCYERLIGDEARKVCDQTQDDVQSEATVRP